MTREEAILLLHDMKDTYDEIHENTNYEIGYEQMTALDMAIEALHREEAEEKGYCHRIIPSNVEVVVRCKDCRHGEHIQIPIWDNRDIDKAPSQFHDFIKCHKFHIKGFNETLYLGDDDYCSWGERREP